MHRVMCILVIAIFSLFTSGLNGQSKRDTILTIEMAVNKTIEHNPELKVLKKNIAANKAVKLQSGLMPNPEFGLEAENIFGNNDFSGFRGSEITASISQNILLAGKISKLEKIADADISLSEWDYEAKRLEIITNIRKSFINALGVQKLIEKNKGLINISNEFVDNLKKRVRKGKISPAEVSRAQIVLSLLQIEINKLESEYDTSIFEMKTLINNPSLSFEFLKGELKDISSLPDYDSLRSKLKNNPVLKRYSKVYEKQKAVINYEESKSIPNLTVSVGFRKLNEVNANTFLVGASIPLPIFNRNQGTIQEAKIRLEQKKIEYINIKNKLTLRFNLYFNKLKMLLTAAEKLKSESLPISEEAFKIINEGNLVGRFTILDVLDAQRTLFEIQNRYMRILKDINTTIVEIEGLTVTNIE